MDAERKDLIEDNSIESIEIEPLSDEALESVSGGGSSDGANCCSCDGCSNKPPAI